jgi:hypothetical protein
MNVAALMAELRCLGVVLTIDGGRLVVDSPAGVLTADKRASIVRLKSELLARLLCVECGGPLPPGHVYRCHACTAQARLAVASTPDGPALALRRGLMQQ